LVELSTLGGVSSTWVLINLRPQRDETSNVLTQPPRHETGAQHPETHVAHLMRSRPAPARILREQGLEARFIEGQLYSRGNRPAAFGFIEIAWRKGCILQSVAVDRKRMRDDNEASRKWRTHRRAAG
jgi:hypothetical protein